MQTITNKGTFVFVVTGLAACDKIFADTITQEEETGGGPISQELINLKGILKTLTHAGTTRITRNKWHLIDHPVFGQISWKFRKDHRKAYERFCLRVNGRLVIQDNANHLLISPMPPYTTTTYKATCIIHRLIRQQAENKRWETVWALRQEIVAIFAQNNIELPLKCYDPNTEILNECNLSSHLQDLKTSAHDPKVLEQIQQVLK